MNLIEGGRPRIGCIRRQPSARKLVLSLAEGRPSMGKIAGSRRKKGRAGKRTLSNPDEVIRSSEAQGRWSHSLSGRIKPLFPVCPGQKPREVGSFLRGHPSGRAHAERFVQHDPEHRLRRLESLRCLQQGVGLFCPQRFAPIERPRASPGGTEAGRQERTSVRANERVSK